MNLKYRTNNYLNIFTHTSLGMSLPVWIRLLARNRFSVDIRFLPKILFITGNIILNIPFQLYEYFRYNKKIKSTRVQRPVFIIGYPRSGTTYLHYTLSKDPAFSFCSTNEAIIPHTFLSIGNFTRKILDMAMPETRPQDNVKAGSNKPKEEEFALGNISNTSFVHGFYFPKSMYSVLDEAVLFEKNTSRLSHWKEHMDFFVKKLNYKYPGKRILLKSPANTGRVREILELYPDACFIHIHRNPYDVYQSNEKLYEKILPLLAFQKIKNEFVEDYILYSYERVYKKYLKDKLSIPNKQFFEVSYVDFISSPMEQLERAYTHLDLGDYESARPYLNEEIKSVKGYQKNSYSSLDETIKNRISEKWSFFFETYGYKK